MREDSEADSQSDGRENESELSFFPNENKEEFIFQKTVTAVQSWFTLFGWSKGPNPVSIPHSLRRDVCKVEMTSSLEKVFQQNLEKDTIYDMLFHLSGQLLPGITLNRSLPLDPVERMIHLYWQHSTLLTFLNRGASLPHVMPEYLFEPDDYKKWTKMQAELQVGLYFLLLFSFLKKDLMQVLVFQNRNSILIKNNPTIVTNVPRINSELLSSNIYSPYERIILTWLNKNYENNRKTVWKDGQKGKIPLMRWIVNFDRDLLDGLVLAAQMAAYCPFLIASHFVRMYTYPRTPAHFLHNCLILVNAINFHSFLICKTVCVCVYIYINIYINI
uniref:Cilia- and flagella-associated protein 47 domain-containing protein n=1 Tax=Meleagris gallopavo TaxID=9103 RepID=G1NP62_MELGA